MSAAADLIVAFGMNRPKDHMAFLMIMPIPVCQRSMITPMMIAAIARLPNMLAHQGVKSSTKCKSF